MTQHLHISTYDAMDLLARQSSVNSACEISSQVHLPKDDERDVVVLKYCALSLVAGHFAFLRIGDRSIGIFAWIGVPVRTVNLNSSAVFKHEINTADNARFAFVESPLGSKVDAASGQFFSNAPFKIGNGRDLSFNDILGCGMAHFDACFFGVRGTMFWVFMGGIVRLSFAPLANRNTLAFQINFNTTSTNAVFYSKILHCFSLKVLFYQCGRPFYAIIFAALSRTINAGSIKMFSLIFATIFASLEFFAAGITSQQNKIFAFGLLLLTQLSLASFTLATQPVFIDFLGVKVIGSGKEGLLAFNALLIGEEKQLLGMVYFGHGFHPLIQGVSLDGMSVDSTCTIEKSCLNYTTKSPLTQLQEVIA